MIFGMMKRISDLTARLTLLEVLTQDDYQRTQGRLDDLREAIGRMQEKATLFCSFCGDSQHKVKKLVAGPGVFICDECAIIAADIVKEERR